MTEIRFEPTPEQTVALQRLAKEMGKAENDIISEAISEWIQDVKDLDTAKSRYESLEKIWTQEELERGADLEN